jgi:GT2 family glycosyltransferase
VSDASPTLACVLLTMGDRPAELERAVRSVSTQHGAPIEVVVVGNGVEVPDPGAAVRTVSLPQNVGVPAGRNVGWAQTSADVVIFLDDDGWFPQPDVGERLRAAFAADPRLGIVAFRVTDPDDASTQRRHVPRLVVGDPMRSSEVTTFVGGACAVRRRVLEQVGGLPDAFFYAHEETDLAWRALDAGWRIRYDAGVLMHHPGTSPTRHASYLRLNARNRVWLARRNLPAALAVLYLLCWVALTVVRVRQPAALKAWFAGFVEGLRTDAGARQPLRWATAWRMTRLGRPPVL